MQPHGAFKFKLIGCTPGFSAQISVSWPSLVGVTAYKFGRSSALATSSSYFVAPGLTIVGNKTVYTVTDGQLGDDDWVADGVIIDPVVPVALPIAPVPTLGQWGVLILALLMASLAAWQGRRRGDASSCRAQVVFDAIVRMSTPEH